MANEEPKALSAQREEPSRALSAQREEPSRALSAQREELIARARLLELSGQYEPALQLHRRFLEETPDAPATVCVRAGELALQLRSAGEAAACFAVAADRFEQVGLRNLAVALRVRALRADPSRVEDYRRLAELACAAGYAVDARAGCLEYAEHAEREGAVDGAAALLRAHVSRFPYDDEVRHRLTALGFDEPTERESPVAHPADAEESEAEMPSLDLLPTLLDAGSPEPVAPALPGIAAEAVPAADGLAELPTLEGLEPTSAAGEWEAPRAPAPPAAGEAELLPLLDVAPEPEASDVPAPADPVGAEELPLLGLDGEAAADGPRPEEPDFESDSLPVLAGLDALPALDDEPALEAEPAAEAGESSAEPEAEALPVLARPPVEADPQPTAETAPPADGFVDLGALIFGDEEEADTRVRVEMLEPEGEEEADIEEILDLFREKVAQTIDPEDSASHYDLGLAFKEMGLLDDAIAQLQRALRGGAAPLATLEVLGECFVQKAEYAMALRILERAARLPDTEEHELIGVVYSLGVCQEALGEPRLAAASYERVVTFDIGFRDAAPRLDALRRAEVAAAL
jgi:tetratricopeptide (TPR) repeat protein